VVIKFGNGRSVPVIQPSDSASIALKVVDEKLKAQEAKLEQQLENLAAKARRMVSTDQKGTKAILQRKKAVEVCLSSRREARDNVLKVMMTIQSATTNQELIEALRESATAIKGLNTNATPEQVSEVLAEMSEHMADVEQVNELLTSNELSEQEEQELEHELALLTLADTPPKSSTNLQQPNQVTTPLSKVTHQNIQTSNAPNSATHTEQVAKKHTAVLEG